MIIYNLCHSGWDLDQIPGFMQIHTMMSTLFRDSKIKKILRMGLYLLKEKKKKDKKDTRSTSNVLL